MLEPLVMTDHEAVSRHAQAWLAEQLRERPGALLCLASGASPMRTYELLAARHRADPHLLNRVRVLKLDEWGGLAMNDPATCEQHLRRALITPLKLEDRYVGFESLPADPQAECRRMATWLQKNGPIDVCVLGLGLNGHLGFNEPANRLQPHAHVAELSETSLTHAMISASSDSPRYGLTLGMADILQSRRLRRLLTGEIKTDFPASLLTLHSDVLLLCDEAASP
jgi:galactosamine-6-phosphate isomerase